MLQWKTMHVHHLVCVWVYLEEKFLELEPLKSQRTGYMYLKFDSFSQIAPHRFISAYGHTSKVCEYLLPILCQYSLFSAFFGFAKPYVKNNISYFTLPFPCYEWCQVLSHDWKPIVFLILKTICSYSMPVFLLRCWALLVIGRSYFYIKEINPLWYKLQFPPQIIISLLKQKAKTFWNSPIPSLLPAVPDCRQGLYLDHLCAPSPWCRAWPCKLSSGAICCTVLKFLCPHPTRPPQWLGSSISTSNRKRWLFSLLTTAMHLFGLNWHLQPLEGQMYEITEDTASSWPVPTDVSLYPSGGTGLEIPDRKGKGTTEGRVAVLSVSWVLCVCLCTKETSIMCIMCLTHSSMLWPFLPPSALHAGCQCTCVFIAVPCHCELRVGLGQGSRCSPYPISCLKGSIMGFHTAGVAAFDCVGPRWALLGKPRGWMGISGSGVSSGG